jgi:hypothetical protein
MKTSESNVAMSNDSILEFVACVMTYFATAAAAKVL